MNTAIIKKLQHYLAATGVAGFFAMAVLYVSPVSAADGDGNARTRESDMPHLSEELRYRGIQAKFFTMISEPGVLSRETLNEVDFEVRSIALYRVSDRQNKIFPRSFYESMEQKLIDKFIGIKRFSVHECFECKTTRILLKEKHFEILRQLDSNESFAKIGKKIGVDSFMLWDAYLYRNEPVLNIRIVSAENGQVRWSKQYQQEHSFEYNWEFYTSFWNIDLTRAATTADSDVVVTPLLVFGTRAITRSTISRNLIYGYGAEFFYNTSNRDKAGVYGFTLNGRVGWELDTAFGSTDKSYGNWIAYGALGQAFVIFTPSLMGRLGLEIRINKKSYVDVGAIYLQPTAYDETSLVGYEPTATLGGLGYEFSLGMRF